MDVAGVYCEDLRKICAVLDCLFIILLTSLVHYIVVVTKTRKQIPTSLYVKHVEKSGVID